MSEIYVRQIRSQLEKTLCDYIDISDVASRSTCEQDTILATRSLAAFCLMNLADINAISSSECVTDGYQDKGIEYIYYNSVYVI